MIDPNTAMSAAGEGAKAVSKFEEILQKIYGPKWTRKQADADAYADARKLQTIRDNPDMEIVFANGQMNARARTPEALALRAKQRLLAESIRQEENLEDILEIARDELSSTESVSDDAVNEDWITRFIGIVKDVSADEMKFLWGKMLSGEVNKPGSFSLRTLDVIRNISKKEAEAFQHLCPLVLSCPSNRDTKTEDYFVLANSFNNNRNIEYNDLLLLEDAGLLSMKDFVSIDFAIAPYGSEILKGCGQSIKISNKIDKEIRINHIAFFLTTAGKELFSLLAAGFSATNEYLSETISLIKEEHQHLSNFDAIEFEIVE